MKGECLLLLKIFEISESRGGTRLFNTNILFLLNRYCFRVPDNYPLELAAPLLCAGITVYTPMIRHNMNQPGKTLGVIGLGGLGHLAVKFGKAFGLKVTVFSTSLSKKEEAVSRLGADNIVVSSDEQQLSVSYHQIVNCRPLLAF